MNKLIIFLLISFSLASTEIDLPKTYEQEPSKDIKAYGSINSKHFNSLSKTYIEKDIEAEYKRKLERQKNQLEKLF